jgi:tetratricopeptide (TPR) repeat protein
MKMQAMAGALALAMIVATPIAAETDARLEALTEQVDAGETLGNSEKFAEAVAQFDKAITALEAAGDMPGRDAQLAKAMGMRSAALGRMDRFDEAFAASVAVEDRFGDNADPDARQYVAMAMMVRGMMHSHRKDQDAALASWEQLGLRYGQDPAANVREVALTAMVTRMMTLNEMGRKDEALALADSVLAGISEDSPPEEKQLGLSVAMLRAAMGMESEAQPDADAPAED